MNKFKEKIKSFFKFSNQWETRPRIYLWRGTLIPSPHKWSTKEIELRTPSFLRNTNKNFQKNGYVLLISLLISFLFLTISMGILKFIVADKEISADTFFGEKAYFAAESGVEEALLELKNDPTKNIKKENVPFNENDDSAVYSIDTGNRVQDFEMNIETNDTSKFRLQVDQESGEKQAVENFQITPNRTRFHWKIICQKDSFNKVKTIALQNDWQDDSTMRELSHLTGTYDDETGTSFENVSVLNFFGNTGLPSGSKPSFESPDDKKSCFFSVTNLEQDAEKILSIKIKNPYGFLSPEKARVTSHGMSGFREKIIQFEYRQSHLSPFFDFGLLEKKE